MLALNLFLTFYFFSYVLAVDESLPDKLTRMMPRIVGDQRKGGWQDLSNLISARLEGITGDALDMVENSLRQLASQQDIRQLIQDLKDLDISQIIRLKSGVNEATESLRMSPMTTPSRFAISPQNALDSGYLPVVQMHGMGDFANDPFGMVPLAQAISQDLNGTYVLNVPIGDNMFADIMNGFLMNLDDQVDVFAATVRADPTISAAKAFNAVGYSQGNLIIRGYIERYNDPPIRNFISVHGPLAGVAAFPNCALSHSVCRVLTEVLGALAYKPLIQEHLTQANYFRDPFKTDAYRTGARFLPDLNNERDQGVTVNASYVTHWTSLNSLCLVKALGDTIVIPNESEWFGFYQDKSFDNLWTFDQTPWYVNDWFGLKSLHLAGKITFETTDGNHLDFDTDYLLSLVDRFFK